MERWDGMGMDRWGRIHGMDRIDGLGGMQRMGQGRMRWIDEMG